MRILLISNLFPPRALGGYEILCGQVRDALRERGHGVTVLTSDHGVGGQADEEGVRRALRLYVPFHRPAGMMRLRRLRVGRENARVTADEIGRVRPDVVFLWSQLRLTVGPARAAEASGVPVAYTFNDENILGYLPGAFSWRPRKLARFVIEKALLPGITLRGLRLAPATCISLTLRDRLIERGLPATDLRVIYQGIPIERFPLRDNPGSPHAPARALYVGQLHPWKGVHTLIEAARRIAERRGEEALRVTVVGKGSPEYEAELRRQAEARGCPVTFRGAIPHDRIASCYREHDFFCFPSTWPEPFGLTHLEAMASGLPVVSTTTGGQGEFLEADRNALVFEKEDAEGLACQIERLLDDAALRARLARAGRETVERRFTLERYVSDLEAFLVEAAG